MEVEAEYEKRRTKRTRKRHMLICLIITFIILIIIIGLVLYFIVLPLLMKEESLDFRLPSALVPQLYILQIHPQLMKDNFTFTGNVTITINCVSATRKVILHAKDLDILETSIVKSDSNLAITSVKKDEKNDFLILNTKEYLKENNKYQINIRFSGYLNDAYRGFYWKNYTSDGKTKYIAATNFKPTYARRAFPCFDEPALKTSFHITIVRSSKEKSLSNMRKKLTENRGDDLEADVYSPTYKISTYTVSYFIGDFSSIEFKGFEKTTVSIWASTKSKANKIKYNMGEAFDLFEKHFKKLNFPITADKIDVLAIPNESGEPMAEFEPDGAMGCWGLITMDEHTLDFDRDDLSKKQTATSQLAHAFAHQLIDTIVTPEWWDDAWLSESIATYLEISEINDLFPEWNWMSRSVMKLNEHVEEDCSASPHMTSTTVDKPSKILKQLNSFAVSLKGWRTLRMVNYIMGDNRFWMGLSKFLQDNAFKSVNQNKFWHYLIEAQSNQYRLDLKSLIDNWIYNPGHPLLTVRRQDSSRTFHLNQVPCSKDPSTVWKIPLTYMTENKKFVKEKVDMWLLSANGSIKTSVDKFNWILVNPDQMAFYHVNYDKENWELLADKLIENYQIIPEVNRYQLLFDSLYFARKNLSSYENFFNVLTYLENEDSDEVIEFLAIANLSDIGKMVRRRAQRDWKEYIGKITKKIYEEKLKDKKFDKSIESETKLALRREVLTGVCSIDEPSCVDLAKRKSEEWIKKKESINKNDYPVIKLFMCTAIRNDNSKWENIESYFKELDGKFPANEIIYALGCIEDQYKLHRVLNIGLFENIKYLPFIFESILDNDENWVVIFDILKSEWNRLKKNSDWFKKTMEILTDVVANHEELAKVNELCEKNVDNMTKNEKNLVDKLRKKAEKRISSMDHQLPDMIRWLENKSWNRG